MGIGKPQTEMVTENAETETKDGKIDVNESKSYSKNDESFENPRAEKS